VGLSSGRSNKRVSWWIGAVCFGGLGVSAAAQVPHFPVSVEVVRVSVLVKGRDGPLPDLAAADFELRDNGVPQQIEAVSSEHLPLSLILAFDVSGSVQGPALGALKRAAHGTIDRLEQGDEAALLTFAYSLRLEPRLGRDLAKVRVAIDAAQAEGGTSLVDGTFAAMALGDATPGRVVAVVFTDGKESTSWLPQDEVLEAARQSDVVVYGVEVGATKSAFLGRVADATGGRLLRIREHGALGKAFLEILEEFRARYLLRYTPRGVQRSGWHTLSVRVKGRPATILARKGYRATP
jgi:Ca-activated chloride channel family protein